MITISEGIKHEPFQKFINFYNKAAKLNQSNIEAACISTCHDNLPDSRFVNIKFLNKNGFIFFSNYNSPKAHQLKNNNYASIIFYWTSINTQIRIKSRSKKIPSIESDVYFSQRDINKNALAISSNQSKKIESFEKVEKNFLSVLNRPKAIVMNRPDYWGGYILEPYYFEFWEGDDSRLNKREIFDLKNDYWRKYYLQP